MLSGIDPRLLIVGADVLTGGGHTRNTQQAYRPDSESE